MLLDAIVNDRVTSVLGATITAGTLSSVTSISQHSFLELETPGITTADAYTPLPARANPVNTLVEISADGTNYFVDTTGENPLPAGSVDVIVPSRFLKYTRLAYQSATPGAASTINVIFDAQGT
ncbi:DUF6385 domain-containing protein [Paenibacillus donghaensis]|uniref:DUF6385 domain-containing protein n=1 Tax=Paenibacillus donghaensis TaxID=414771 RepID=UPI001B80207F|nr:DUF6385 domain-containing protein [Paenibacillus donghaensis]